MLDWGTSVQYLNRLNTTPNLLYIYIHGKTPQVVFHDSHGVTKLDLHQARMLYCAMSHPHNSRGTVLYDSLQHTTKVVTTAEVLDIC